MKNMKIILIWALGAVVLLSSCMNDPYEEMKSRELGSEVRYDSILLGLKFGMSRQQFFDRFWELNKQKIVREGPANSSVQYPLKDQLGSAGVLQFYPNFHQEKAYEVQASFYYDGWAPWNRHLFADSLKPKVRDLLADWYDVEFIELKDTKAGDVFVRIDGNRRIVIGVRDEQIVDVSITDMTVADLLLEDPFIK